MNAADDYNYAEAFAALLRLIPDDDYLVSVRLDVATRRDPAGLISVGMVDWHVETINGPHTRHWQLFNNCETGAYELGLVGSGTIIEVRR